ncbi:tyrosine-type recombinase/integrase [Streptococcus danieliae]|nr:tyrosine-type recombinase/integrase [Streptococcus danieliae]
MKELLKIKSTHSKALFIILILPQKKDRYNMIGQYKKGGTTAYYFKAYHGIDPLSGKKIITKRRGFKTEREARLAEAKCLSDYEKKTFRAKNTTTTFAQVYEIWKSHYKNTVKESTFVSQTDIAERHILPVFGHKPINKITLTMCQTQLNEWATKYKRFFGIASIANQVFDYAISMELIENNPMRKTLKPKRQKKETGELDQFYNKDELQEFFSLVVTMDDPEMLTFLRLLAFTGMRKNEVAALMWKDIDLKDGFLKVNRTLAKGEGNKIIFQTPKTKKSARTIVLDPQTVQVLKDWKVYSTKGLLFKNENGDPKSIVHVNNMLNRIWRRYPGFKRITPHGFRHTHCSLLFEAGASVKEVQERLGHENIQTTMDIYAHVTQNAKNEVANKFASYIGF